MKQTETIIRYVKGDTVFHVERRAEEVEVYYFAYFDRETGETDEISASFPLEDYSQGIEKLLTEGRCDIGGGRKYLNIRKEEKGVNIDLHDGSCLGIYTSLPIDAEQFRL
jgi:hypothetical protein